VTLTFDRQTIEGQGHWERKCRKIVFFRAYLHQNSKVDRSIYKKAVLPQGNRAMLQVFFSVEIRQQHSLQV